MLFFTLIPQHHRLMLENRKQLIQILLITLLWTLTRSDCFVMKMGSWHANVAEKMNILQTMYMEKNYTIICKKELNWLLAPCCFTDRTICYLERESKRRRISWTSSLKVNGNLHIVLVAVLWLVLKILLLRTFFFLLCTVFPYFIKDFIMCPFGN